MKFKLPNVTLVCAETRQHELARLAVEDCCAKVKFGDVLILTDKPRIFSEENSFKLSPLADVSIRFHLVPDWPNKVSCCRSRWYDVPPLLRTTHMLQIEWDSWIWHADMWRDEFLDYDYIGAPWWHRDGKNVGNGGFSLISTRLKRYLADRRAKYPCDSNIDDDLLCRTYRKDLEKYGFVWAPEKVAYDFSYEGCAGNPPTRHFGFHAAMNFGYVLDHDRLLERGRIMLASQYIRESYIGKAFAQKNPDIVEEIRQEASVILSQTKELP